MRHRQASEMLSLKAGLNRISSNQNFLVSLTYFKIYLMSDIQSILTKYNALVVATLDYLIENYTGEFVYDGCDPIRMHYQFEQKQAAEYEKLGDLQRLEQQLDLYTGRLLQNADFGFTDYIRQRTGYEFDIFNNLKIMGDEVLSRAEIADEAECRKVEHLLFMNGKLKLNHEENKKFVNLLGNFRDKMRLVQENDPNISKVSRTEERDGETVEVVEISFGPQPKHSKRREIASPDKKRSLQISEWMHQNGEQAITSVGLSFRTASGGVYAVDGIQPDLNAYWKDNQTVIIETHKGYKVLTQHRLMQSFDDVVKVVYIENAESHLCTSN